MNTSIVSGEGKSMIPFRHCIGPTVSERSGKSPSKARFKEVELRVFEGRPEYLRMTSLTYLLGMIYEKMVNKFDLFETFRAVIMGSARK